jgi:TolB-like protein
MRRFVRFVSTLTLAGAVAHQPVTAQSAPRPIMLLTDFAFNGAAANAIQPGDTAVADIATERMRADLVQSSTFAVLDSSRAAAALGSGDLPPAQCRTSVQCVRTAAHKVGARWAVTGTVTKVSNLIWYLSAQLIDVASGRLVLDDGFELKGPRDEIVPRGATSFARRIETAAAREAGGQK